MIACSALALQVGLTFLLDWYALLIIVFSFFVLLGTSISALRSLLYEEPHNPRHYYTLVVAALYLVFLVVLFN